jgi:hypothetical protein
VATIKGRHVLTCKECDYEELEASTSVVAVICAYCVQKMISPPDSYKKEKSDKPRGWHLKLYFEHNGVVYSKGVAVTDPAELKALKKLNKASVKKATKSTTSTTTGKKRGRPRKIPVTTE